MEKVKILLILWICLGLAALATKLPGLSTFVEEGEEVVWEEDAPVEPDTNSMTSTTSITSMTSMTSTTSTTSTTDSAAPLQRFYAALEESGERVVRVMHYGDSQIEEDRITSVIRRHLQELYGGSGVGLVPLHQTIPTFSLRQRLTMNGRVQSASEGPKRYLVYGPKFLRRPDTCMYGPMGQVAMMNDSLAAGSEELMVSLQPLRGNRHTLVRLIADSTIHSNLNNDTCYLYGCGAVYGISLESNTGVIVDNIPMRGSLGTVFTEMDSVQLTQFYQENNVRLIILQYGGNFIAGAKTEQGIRSAVYSLRQQIELLQQLAPNADLLYIGPSDMLINDEAGLHTNPLVPIMDGLLENMCRKKGVTYFSLYRSMGGENSMLRWQEAGLAGEDGIHFTRAGAEKAGKMIIETWKR